MKTENRQAEQQQVARSVRFVRPVALFGSYIFRFHNPKFKQIIKRFNIEKFPQFI